MNPDTVTNDIIKLDNSTFCFIGCSRDNDKIYVSIFQMGSIKVLVNCYIINLYNDYNLTLFRDVQSILFNKFVAFGSSICVGEGCNDTNIYSTLIVFSYPNSTDIDLDIVDFLCNKTDNNSYDDMIFNISQRK